jgi:hypothetical protein
LGSTLRSGVFRRHILITRLINYRLNTVTASNVHFVRTNAAIVISAATLTARIVGDAVRQLAGSTTILMGLNTHD